MEDNKINPKEDLNDINEVNSINYNKKYYCCSECSAIIEIINIDDEYIEFKCKNNHNIKMKIKEYLNKMKLNINIALKEYMNKCDNHKEKYISYCFYCNEHLCNECLRSGKHRYHNKINIIEIIPNNELLLKIKNLIKNNKLKIKDLNKNKESIEKQINDIFNENINKFKEIKMKKKKKNNSDEKKELKLTKNKYKLEVEELKIEYNNKIKNLKMNYNTEIIKIKNKYKIENNKNEYLYNNKIKEIKKEISRKMDNYKFIERLDKISSFNELLEIIYNTYNKNNNSYYNAININNIYNKYFNIVTKLEGNEIKKCNMKINDEDNFMKNNNEQISQLKKEISENRNTIKIIYKIDKNEKEIKIFGDKFVKNNKNNCKILYGNKILDLV